MDKSDIKDIISKYEINIAYSDEDEGYVARVIDVPEFEFNVAFGETREEALKELEWVMKSVIEIRIKEGWSLPKPTKTTINA